MIPYGHQQITEDDIQAVVDVLKSDYLTQGEAVPAFEQAVCKYTGARHGVAVNSATSALHLACLALGLGEGDWLWTTPVTFVASANCGRYCGAKVDFVDIDPRTWNLDPAALEKKLIQAEREKRLPKIVVVVHLCGLPCDMAEIARLASQYGFKVIEDASHAIGGRIGSSPIGNGEYSDITVFSFHPVKIITTGEGGMAVTNTLALAEHMALHRSHGITRDPELMDREADGGWYYQQLSLGFNYRITDIQAALGCSQLKRIESFVSRRHEIADLYDELLASLPVKRPFRSQQFYSGLHLYVIRVEAERHKQAFDFLRSNGIGVNLHYIPVHTQPYYRQFGFSDGDYPAAEQYYREAISLPMYPDLTDDQVRQVCARVAEALS